MTQSLVALAVAENGVHDGAVQDEVKAQDKRYAELKHIDFKAQAVELSRQLIVSQAESQARRLASMNNDVWQAMQSPIKDTSIGR